VKLKGRTKTPTELGARGWGLVTPSLKPQVPSPKPQVRVFNSKRLVFASLIVWTVLFVVSVYAQNGAAPQKLNPYTGKAEAITEGQQLYKKFNCYGCHGMQGGGGMGPNLTDETWQAGDGSDSSLLSQVRDGKGQMPPFKTLMNDDQAWKLIAFVRSLYKGDPKKANW